MDDLRALEREIKQSEDQVPNLRRDCAKEIIWAGAAGQVTEWSVVFIHGFSATKHEIRPVPDLIAKALGANLFLTRISGHGQDSAAMGEVDLNDWRRDAVQAFSVGHKIGRKLMVIGCSTGCTLGALHLADGGQADAFVQVSPNYGLRFWPMQKLLEWPALHPLHSLTIGRDFIFPPISPEHEAYWTLTYPLAAVSVTAEAVRACEKANLAAIKTPTLMALNPADKVISPQAARQAAERWGGPIAEYQFKQTDADDKLGHVMAGDVFSPGQTGPLVRRILDWMAGI